MPSPDPNVVALQKEINRFANDPDIGFASICCDGIPGPATFTALMYALTSINLADQAKAQSSCPGSDVFPVDTSSGDACPSVADVAGSYIDGINSDADITGSIYGLTQTLQMGASAMGFSYITCPPAASCSGGAAPNTSHAQQVQAQALSKYKGSGTFIGLPMWAAWGLGGVLVLVGAVTVRDRLRRR